MKVKNKKLAKVSFFLFLFFSFLALGFTLSNTVSAYTSDDMPEGYRPITYEDQGKIFGVDLEPVIYFDTSTDSYIIPPKTYHIQFTDDTKPNIFAGPYSAGFNPLMGQTYFYQNEDWVLDTFTLEQGYIVNFLDENSLTYFSSWLYVKDIVPNIPIIDSILSLFNNLIIWIPSTITGLILIFYSSETGLTFLGALAVAGLGISVIFLLIGIIQNFLHFRG